MVFYKNNEHLGQSGFVIHRCSFLYCTEPNPGETLNSGVMKDLTGGEQVKYRMLFSNTIVRYMPQFKLHIMTNDLPKIDGADKGVERRVRVLPYVSSFVSKEELGQKKGDYVFEADTEVTYSFREHDEMRMEFMRYILDHYDHEWDYSMTNVIRESSRGYLNDNDNVGKFVNEHLERDKDSFVTLKDLKMLYKTSDYFDGQLTTLKVRLERVLGTPCLENKKINGVKHRSVFEGFKILTSDGVYQIRSSEVPVVPVIIGKFYIIKIYGFFTTLCFRAELAELAELA